MRIRWGLLLVVSLAAGARAQDIEQYIFAHFEDKRLEDVAKEIAAICGVKVRVDAELRDRKITVDLEDSPEDALRKIARAGKAHLWKLEDGSYRIRAKAEPKSTGKKTGKKPAPKRPLPAWKKKILARLEKAHVDVEFQGTPLREALAALSRAARVHVSLDPEVERTRKAEDLEVNVLHVPSRSTVAEALRSVAGSVKLHHDLRWGGVFVSTSERLEALGLECVPAVKEGAPEWEKEIRKKLEKPVSVSQKMGSVSRAIDSIARLGGVKIRYDAKVLRGLPRVTIDVKAIPLKDALALILVPRELGIAFEKKALKVGKR
ncbi:MAG: hypothetical protein ACYTDY_00510 [Planctomycetota bacterium]|jgi:hypothetical protein